VTINVQMRETEPKVSIRHDQIFKKNRCRSLDDVLNEFQASYRQKLKAMPRSRPCRAGPVCLDRPEMDGGQFHRRQHEQSLSRGQNPHPKWARANKITLGRVIH
jgi:hypothetical protein